MQASWGHVGQVFNSGHVADVSKGQLTCAGENFGLIAKMEIGLRPVLRELEESLLGRGPAGEINGRFSYR